MGPMLRRASPSDDTRIPAPPSDAEADVRLIARIAARDLRAFETLYRAYHPRLTRFLLNMLRHPQLAEEALDDAMMVVWRRPEGFNGTSKVSTWIFAIAYRTALKARSRHREPMEEPDLARTPSEEPDPEQRLGIREANRDLLRAMGRLSAEHRAVVDLTYFHDVGYREIAEILDCPVGTVKTRMHHAKRHLKGFLQGELDDWL
jgi:RNA polymerase sigma factor (sigma-70 family)